MIKLHVTPGDVVALDRLTDEKGRLIASVYETAFTSLFQNAPEMMELLRQLAVGYDEDDGQGIYQRIDDFIDFTHQAQALIAKIEGGGE